MNLTEKWIGEKYQCYHNQIIVAQFVQFGELPPGGTSTATGSGRFVRDISGKETSELWLR